MFDNVESDSRWSPAHSFFLLKGSFFLLMLYPTLAQVSCSGVF